MYWTPLLSCLRGPPSLSVTFYVSIELLRIDGLRFLKITIRLIMEYFQGSWKESHLHISLYIVKSKNLTSTNFILEVYTDQVFLEVVVELVGAMVVYE